MVELCPFSIEVFVWFIWYFCCFQVVCISTGTKCLNGEHINNRGMAVNDCHAEVIARRGLRHFLMSQLEYELSSIDSTIYDQVSSR